MERHELLGGKVHVYKRPGSQKWHCSATIGGEEKRATTGEESLALAKEVAEDWYLTLRGKFRGGELRTGKKFREVAELFLKEYPVITAGHRSQAYLASQERRIRNYLTPFFGPLTMGEITSAKIQEYRIERAMSPRTGKPRARATIHQEIVALRHVLKTARRNNWIETLPDLSPPYKMAGKIGHRAWFSPEEYRRFYEATRRRAKEPLNNRWRWECEQFHDWVLFMANTGLRPDEAAQLQYRDVSIIKDDATRETILLIEVRGKRGVGYCKSTSQAVRPFERLRERNVPQPSDLVFPQRQHELLNTILGELGLKFDRDGNRRTAYSLRHTYICFRLMEGADIYQIAKNCRTSVEVIEKHYAVHLKTALDAAAINVRRRRVSTSRAGRSTDRPTQTPRRRKTAWRKRPRPV
jgi:integrase